ncbi:Uncharacterised protein at_DN0281 [Pycnogonum litorale]
MIGCLWCVIDVKWKEDTLNWIQVLPPPSNNLQIFFSPSLFFFLPSFNLFGSEDRRPRRVCPFFCHFMRSLYSIRLLNYVSELSPTLRTQPNVRGGNFHPKI